MGYQYVLFIKISDAGNYNEDVANIFRVSK
jgi:hypothetical protein